MILLPLYPAVKVSVDQCESDHADKTSLSDDSVSCLDQKILCIQGRRMCLINSFGRNKNIDVC